jgi:hypothetical protein
MSQEQSLISKPKPNQPSKEAIRAWLAQRMQQREPLPDIAQIREKLNWLTWRPGP